MTNHPRLVSILLLATCSLAIGGFLRAQAPSAPAPNPNVEVIDLGPAPTTGGYASIALTPGHRHSAITGPSGSRAAAFVDGRAGDKYDQIQTIPPVLSADGKHWAYAARKGTQWFVVVDGKEYGPYDRLPGFVQASAGGAQPMPDQITPAWPIVFSPDSKHSAFYAQKGNLGVVVEDGKEISSGAVGSTPNLLFSKQGDHLVFITRDTVGGWSVVLDGVTGLKYQTIYPPQFSDDGHHLMYVGMKTPGKYTLVVDGSEGPLLSSIGNNSGGAILFSPDGAHTAYTATNNGPNLVVIDGKIIPYAERVWMSPDGKTIPYLTRSQQSQAIAVVVNGKPGLEYATLEGLSFAPDGRPIYTARGGPSSKVFLIDGNKESDAYDSADLGSLHFSADGKHTAYVASASGKSFVVLDGKKMTLPPEYQNIMQPSPAVLPGIPYIAPLLIEKMLQFTPDGHIVYRASRYGNPSLIKDDQILGDDGVASPDGRRVASVKTSAQGSSTATAQVTLDGQTGPLFGTITRMVFSPDSKHFAYVGTGRTPIPNGTGKEGGYFLVVDGVQKGEYPEIRDLQFSPDSQHLFHFVTSHLNGGPGMAYMDQQLFYIFYWLPGFWNEWLDDHKTMQIMGGKYDPATRGAADMEFYRVRYFLPGANRNQESPAVAGTGAVDLQETKRMIGSGAVSAAAPTAPGAPPAAAANLPAAASPAAAATPGAPIAQNVLPAGTTVELRMLEAVDSGRDPGGKQYRATVTKAVNAGNMIIGQGSAATVTLAKNGSGWSAQLFSLVINGQVVAVTSASATVTSAGQNSAANVANAVNSVAGLFGKKPSPPPAAVAVATGDRVILPPGTTLSFVLGGVPPSNGAVPGAFAEPAVPAAQPSVAAAAAAVPPQNPGQSYFCEMTITTKPITYYFSGAFQTDANRQTISQAWTQYVRQTYGPGDNRNQGACQIGTADQQQRLEAQRQKSVEAVAAALANVNPAQRNALTQNVVHVDWKYAGATAAPAPGAAASAPAAAQPPAAAAAPAAIPATPSPAIGTSNGASGSLPFLYYCFTNTFGPTMYFAAPFEADSNMNSTLVRDAFAKYLLQMHAASSEATCRIPSSLQENVDAQKELAGYRAQKKVIETGWRYGLPPLAPGQANPVQLEHRKVYYYCPYDVQQSLKSDGSYEHVKYVSDVFQADWDTLLVSQTWNSYIAKTYKLDASSASLACMGGNLPLISGQRDRALLPGARIVKVTWQYVPGEYVPPPPPPAAVGVPHNSGH